MASTKPIDEEEQETKSYEITMKRFTEIIKTLPKAKGWWFDSLYQYKGFWLTSMVSLKGLTLIEDHFNPKSKDIILATSPKSGTNWLRALIFATVNRRSYSFETHPLLINSCEELFPFLEGIIIGGLTTSFENLPSPRLLSTHLPYDLFPQCVKDSDCKFVYICRDPKDVLVSKWHFTNKIRPKEMGFMPLEEAFKLFVNGVSHYGSFWDHVLSYWKASLEHQEKVLFLTYEGLKKKTYEGVKKLAEFLEVPFSLEEENGGVVDEIVRLCSFENLSNLEVNKKMEPKFFFKNPDFYRKGEVGDWKNHLSNDMTISLDRITKEKFHGYGLTFDC